MLFESEMASYSGSILRSASLLESDLDLGITRTLNDIRADEYRALRVIRQERQRKAEEKPGN